MHTSRLRRSSRTPQLLVAVALLLVSGAFTHAADSPSNPPRRPNILFVISDDQSWRDTSINGERGQ